MKYKVIIRPEAENDLKEIFLWYEDKRKGLDIPACPPFGGKEG
jgi:plasmid stabilization system protein ParE